MADYQFYLEKLQLACDKHNCKIHAYVLITNHAHLLITSQEEDGIGKVMQMLGRYYVQYYNYTYQRTGTLWEGRYKATLIDSEAYLLTCMRYIELNPIRANMVSHPSEYTWSSYHRNALGQSNELVTPHTNICAWTRLTMRDRLLTVSFSSIAYLKAASKKSSKQRIKNGCLELIYLSSAYKSNWRGEASQSK